MDYATIRKAAMTVTLAGAAALGTLALAHSGHGGGWGGGYGQPYGMGPGMMGPGMMGSQAGGWGGGYGQPYGMGPGMMGPGMMGGGMGPGMMGGMMGPGMMGPGMMGGSAMGGMGYGVLQQLNLSSDQWGKVKTIHEDLEKKQWDLAGRMREEAFRMRELMVAENRDAGAITTQYQKLQSLRTENFKARLDAHEKLAEVLTKEQKAQLRHLMPWSVGSE